MASTKPGLDVREDILKTAELLISRRGIENTSLLDIANKARVSRGTLYYYFPTKQEILLAITERHMDSVTSGFVRIIRDQNLTDPAAILRRLFEVLLSDRHHGGLQAHLLQEARTNRQVRHRIAERYRAWNAIIVKEFRRLKIRGSKKEKAAFILTVIDGLMLRQYLFGGDARKGPYPDFISAALIDAPARRRKAPANPPSPPGPSDPPSS